MAKGRIEGKKPLFISLAKRIMTIFLLLLLVPMLFILIREYQIGYRVKKEEIVEVMQVMLSAKLELLSLAKGKNGEKILSWNESSYPIEISWQKPENPNDLVIEKEGLYAAIDKDVIRHLAFFSMLEHFVFASLALLIVGLLGAYILTKRMVKPLRELFRVIRTGEKYVEDPLGFELNVLGNHVNTLRASQIQKEILKKEVKLARLVQMSILPKGDMGFPGLHIAKRVVSASNISGDFYDLIPRDSEIFIVVGDVVGKGYSASLFALMLRSYFKTLVATGGTLEKIARETANLFYQDAKKSQTFATVWLGLYNTETKNLSYLSAGHPPAYLQTNTGQKKLFTPHPAMGVALDTPYTEASTPLSPGDLVVIYTDGVLDTENPHEERFGQKKLEEFIREEKHHEPQKFIYHLLARLKRFSQGQSPLDDKAIVVIKVPT